MADPFLGEIRMFAGNYAPYNWAFCEGQLISIVQNSALFSLLGTVYGGDGKSTFALPDLRGRAPIQQGAGPGLTDRVLGEVGGSQTVALVQSEIPKHTHIANSQTTNSADQTSASEHVWSSTGGRGKKVYANTANTEMSPLTVGASGGSQPHNNMQPYLAVHYIIALQGVFPSRP